MRPLRALAAIAAGALAALFGVWSPAAAAPTCDGVWVVVSGGSASGTRCATSFASGKAALQSVGLSPVDKTPGFMCRIGGYPQRCVISVDAYWSYWQASLRPDGSYGPWVYSQLGYTSTRPQRGAAEGWVFGNGKTPPPAPPKKATATSKPPAPPPNTSRPEPPPSVSKPAPPPPTQAPAAPARPNAPGVPEPSRRAPSETGPGSTPPSPAEPTPSTAQSSAQPPTPEAADPVPEQPSETAAPQATAQTPATASPEGSPVAAIGTLAALGVGGGALGVWWWLKRRRG